MKFALILFFSFASIGLVGGTPKQVEKDTTLQQKLKGLLLALLIRKHFPDTNTAIDLVCGPQDTGGEGLIGGTYLIHLFGYTDVFVYYLEEGDPHNNPNANTILALKTIAKGAIDRILEIVPNCAWNRLNEKQPMVVDCFFGGDFGRTTIKNAYLPYINYLNHIGLYYPKHLIILDVASGQRRDWSIDGKNLRLEDNSEFTSGITEVGIFISMPKIEQCDGIHVLGVNHYLVVPNFGGAEYEELESNTTKIYFIDKGGDTAVMGLPKTLPDDNPLFSVSKVEGTLEREDDKPPIFHSKLIPVTDLLNST